MKYEVEKDRTTIREIRTTSKVVPHNGAGRCHGSVTGRPASGDVHVSKKLAPGTECMQERSQEQTPVVAVKTSITYRTPHL